MNVQEATANSATDEAAHEAECDAADGERAFTDSGEKEQQDQHGRRPSLIVLCGMVPTRSRPTANRLTRQVREPRATWFREVCSTIT
jgi:hypothetical protein